MISFNRPKRVALLSSGPPISLKVLYCLHVLGIETDVLDLGEMVSVARYSRYRRRYQRLDVVDDNGEFDIEQVGRRLAAYVGENRIEGLIGGDITSTGVLDAARPWLPDALIFPSSNIDKLELLDDKWRFQQFMVEHDIPCPRSILLERAEDVDAVAAKLSFPIVAKPLHGESSHGVVSVRGIDELRRHVQSGSKYAKLPLLIQEYAVGEDADVSFLAQDGRILCHTMHTRKGGCSLEFMRNDAVYDVAVRIAAASGFTGVANIDVRIDHLTNTVKVLECNPRFWYTLQASMWRGLNFVEAGFSLAIGNFVERSAPEDGSYHLHGCLLTRMIWNPANWSMIERYNIRGLLQAMTDPLPFIRGRS